MQTTTLNVTFSVRNVHSDFMVSREAIGISKRTYKTYNYTLEKFYDWLESQKIFSVNEAFTTRNINSFLAYLREKDNKGKPLSDRYIHIFARVIKTLVRFAYDAYSGAWWPVIPMHAVHRIRRMSSTDSGVCRPLFRGERNQ
jgi:site-specific recombinase XerD